jgi:hypothetical protein
MCDAPISADHAACERQRGAAATAVGTGVHENTSCARSRPFFFFLLFPPPNFLSLTRSIALSQGKRRHGVARQEPNPRKGKAPARERPRTTTPSAEKRVRARKEKRRRGSCAQHFWALSGGGGGAHLTSTHLIVTCSTSTCTRTTPRTRSRRRSRWRRRRTCTQAWRRSSRPRPCSRTTPRRRSQRRSRRSRPCTCTASLMWRGVGLGKGGRGLWGCGGVGGEAGGERRQSSERRGGRKRERPLCATSAAADSARRAAGRARISSGSVRVGRFIGEESGLGGRVVGREREGQARAQRGRGASLGAPSLLRHFRGPPRRDLARRDPRARAAARQRVGHTSNHNKSGARIEGAPGGGRWKGGGEKERDPLFFWGSTTLTPRRALCVRLRLTLGWWVVVAALCACDNESELSGGRGGRIYTQRGRGRRGDSKDSNTLLPVRRSEPQHRRAHAGAERGHVGHSLSRLGGGEERRTASAKLEDRR